MKNAARARCVSVEIDGGMVSLARCESIVKALFRVPATWIENGQPKIVCVLRYHCRISAPVTGLRHSIPSACETENQEGGALIGKDRLGVAWLISVASPPRSLDRAV